MSRARWAVAPGGKVAHLWEEFVLLGLNFEALRRPACYGAQEQQRRLLRDPGAARRCSRCSRKEGKRN